MKKHLNAKNITIVILIILLFLVFLNPGGHLPTRTKYIPKIDSVQYVIHDTITVDSLVEVEVEVEVPGPYEVEKRVEIPVTQPVDTNEILKIHFAKVPHKDVLKLPNNQGTITITDTISKNSIVNRKFIADVKRMIVKDTVYTQIPRKTEAYLGIDAKFDKPNVVNIIGLSMLFKNKDDNHMYRLGVGVTNRIDDQGTNGNLTPFIGGGVYWKLKFKRN
jgi:hypothetical protein